MFKEHVKTLHGIVCLYHHRSSGTISSTARHFFINSFCRRSKTWSDFSSINPPETHDLVLNVPNQVTDSTAESTFTKVPLARLQPPIRLAIDILIQQMKAHFIDAGPSKSELICMVLNRGLKMATILTPGPIKAGNAHVRTKLQYMHGRIGLKSSRGDITAASGCGHTAPEAATVRRCAADHAAYLTENRKMMRTTRISVVSLQR